jgi:hypothetical protein
MAFEVLILAGIERTQYDVPRRCQSSFAGEAGVRRPFPKIVTMTVVLTVAASVLGCSSTHSSKPPAPTLASQDVGWLCGVLNYQGTNPDYVPRSIRPIPESKVHVSYEYQVSYNVEAETGWDLFNPFLLVGVPKSKDNVGVSGRVSISLEGSDFAKTYDDGVVLDKQKFLFSEGETLTEMRRSALIQLRDSMDRKLLSNRSVLSDVGISCGRE